MTQRTKQIIFHVISAVITVICVLFFFRFPHSLERLGEGFLDIGNSLAYYVDNLWLMGWDIKPTVMDLPKHIPTILPLPEEYANFVVAFQKYWQLFVSGDVFLEYVYSSLTNMLLTSQILLQIIPIILLVIYLLSRSKTENNDYGKQTKPLQAYLWLKEHIYRPIKGFVCDYIEFTKRGHYWKVWLIIWLLYFNVYTIILEAVAFYFYLIVSFDLLHIYKQIYKLFLDLYVPLSFIPLWAWVPPAVYFFTKWRENMGYGILEWRERKNRGFIEEQPIAILTTGVMRSGKDLMDTDMCLSIEIMFRNKALELMQKMDLAFPQFPWINFENAIRGGIYDGRIFNLASAKKFVLQRRRFYERYLYKAVDYERLKEVLFGYDIQSYGDEYDDGLKVSYLFDSLVDYAKLYFIYVIECSLIYSNLAVREDYLLMDNGNFPLWCFDLFRTPSVRKGDGSYYSHVLDMDALRDGKKVVENSKASFEFGIIYISEIQNERKNDLGLKEIKASDDNANQKNDGFESRLKTIGHGATIMGFCFVRFLANAQRPEDWGARGREVCSLVRIQERSEMRLALPFFWVEDMIYSMLIERFEDKYLDYRFRRGDTSLLMYLFKSLVARVSRYYNRLYNTFGYMLQKVGVESGTMNGKPKKKRYYLSSKKIFSNRYKTDFLSTIYEAKAIGDSKGIVNMESYSDVTPTMDEMIMVNSYYYDDLIADIYRVLSADGE